MVEVHLTLPDEVAHALGEDPETITRRVLENAAIESYRAGRLSQRQVGEMLGLDYWSTEQFLSEHQVVLNYTSEELKTDRAVLSKIIGRA